MHGEAVAAKRVDQPLVEVIEQTPAVLRKRQRRLVENQVMVRFQQVVFGERTFVQQGFQLIGRERLERLFGRYEPVRETELAVGQDQGRLVAVLTVESGDDAVVEFVADLESLVRRRARLVRAVGPGCGWTAGRSRGCRGDAAGVPVAPRRRLSELDSAALAGRDRARSAARRRSTGLTSRLHRERQSRRRPRSDEKVVTGRINGRQPDHRLADAAGPSATAQGDHHGFHGRCSLADFV